MSEKFLGPAQSYRYNPRALNGAPQFRGSSAVEQSAVNRSVVGSNPTPGAIFSRQGYCTPRPGCRVRLLGTVARRSARETLTAGRNLRQNQCRRILSGGNPATSGPSGRPAGCALRVGHHGGLQNQEALLDDMFRPRARHDYDDAGIGGPAPLLDRLRRPLLLVVLIGGLFGCNTTPQSTVSTPQHVAAAPAANTLERPPVPKRKPAMPSTQTAAVAPEAAPSAESSAPAETHTAALETAPSTPASSLDVPSEIVGMESSAIEQSLGQPESRRDVPPAVVWQYANDACGLDVWLYRDLQSGALRALFVEVKGDDRTDQRRQFCIKQLALQSAGGTHRADPDPTAAR